MIITHGLIHFFFACNILSIGYLAWWYWHQRLITIIEPQASFNNAHYQHRSRRRIALICPKLGRPEQRLFDGIMHALNTSTRFIYTIDVFEGDLRSDLTRRHARDILAGSYQCVISSGLFSTQIMQEALADSKHPLPLVFCNIADRENHIIQHPTAHTWTTGILHTRNIAQELKNLSYLIKQWDQILLVAPIEATPTKDQDIASIVATITENGGVVEHCHATTRSIEPLLAKAQNKKIIITLAHSLTAAQMRTLSSYCSQHGITLYTTDIDMVDHGAAIGSGGGECGIGVTVGDKVKLIVEGALPVNHIPIGTQILQPTIKINKAVLGQQAISATQADLFVIGNGKTVSGVPSRRG